MEIDRSGSPSPYLKELELLRKRLQETEQKLEEARTYNDRRKEELNTMNNQHQMERSFLQEEVKNLQDEVAELTHNEKVLLEQVEILKDEMNRLRMELKATNGEAVKRQLKSTILNWMDFMAKNKKTEAITLCNLLSVQLGFEPNEKSDFISNLDKLKLKKKTV